MEKNIEYYLGLPYTRELIPEASGIWFVSIKELPNCMSQGNTPEEALRNINDAMYGWIKVELEDGEPIPEPRDEEEYSGKFNTRVPKSLHRKLVETADREGVSLNQWINTALAEAIGSSAANKSAKAVEAEFLSTLADWKMQGKQFMEQTSEKPRSKTKGSDLYDTTRNFYQNPISSSITDHFAVSPVKRLQENYAQ